MRFDTNGVGGSVGSAAEPPPDLTFNKAWNGAFFLRYPLHQHHLTRRCWFGASSPWNCVDFLPSPPPPPPSLPPSFRTTFSGFIGRVEEHLQSRFGININPISVVFWSLTDGCFWTCDLRRGDNLEIEWRPNVAQFGRRLAIQLLWFYKAIGLDLLYISYCFIC